MAERFEVADDLPAALDGQAGPRRHAVAEIAVAQEPDELAGCGVLHAGGMQVHGVAEAASVFTVALRAVLEEKLLAGKNGVRIAFVGVVPVDTVKQVTRANGRARVRSTLLRERLVLAQTPQVFHYGLLARAFQAARNDGFIGTDEASLVERLDVEVSVVLGSDRNIKITRPSDMDLARLFFQEQTAGEVHP